MKYIITLILVITFSGAFAQKTIKGMVMDEEHQPLTGATVRVANTTSGAITGLEGEFALEIPAFPGQLIISFIGYVSDTLWVESDDFLHIMLKQELSELDEVVVKSEATFLDKLTPMNSEVITESELLKAACCNLSESFETNASVDVSLTDAVSGAKVIRMLGLDGRYVQINRENIPLVRGLSQRYGLGFVPGTWIQSIDVGKGAGSVVNGYESMSGQINLEFKKPENSESVYLNGYVNSFGKVEVNANHARDLGEKWSTAFLLHADYLGSEIDRNNDNFLDLPKTRQVNLMNRYKYESERLMSQIGINVMLDEKAGGEKGFGFNDELATSPEYGFLNNTSRLEVFGKTGLLFPEKPYMGWGFIYSLSRQNMEGGFGRSEYEGTQNTAYLNAIHQNIIGNTFHQYKVGASLLVDDYEETFVDSTFSRNEIVPGAFFEYSWLPGDQFSLVAGTRVDFHNIYDALVTPRLHMRYQPSEKWTFRTSVGKGFRRPNVIPENFSFLISSRELFVQEEVEMEESWNLGASVIADLEIGEKEVTFIGDYFYTSFVNQLIFDLDQSSSRLTVYNLDGDSYAHSFQLEAQMELFKNLSMKTAYKYYDVKSTINGSLQRVPFVSRDRFFLNLEYATRFEKWKADATVQWFGNKRLPDTSDKPGEFQAPAQSPDFFLVNAQVSRGFRWGTIYLGAENLLDFRQDDPIIDPENPFGNNFDASLVWGPVAGRMIYTGVRYKLKRK